MPATTDGVNITLAGEKVTLRYTLAASMAIDAQFGNFVEAYQRINKFNFEAYPMVVAIGLGKRVKEVEQSVWATGMDALYLDLIEYLKWLSNGGRAPAPPAAVTGAESGNV